MWRLLVFVLLAVPLDARPFKYEGDEHFAQSVKVKKLLKGENLPSSGETILSPYARAIYEERTVRYQVGDIDKGAVVGEDLVDLSPVYAVYRAKKYGIMDILSNDERQTEKGKRHEYCDAPPGSKMYKVRVKYDKRKKKRRLRDLEFIWKKPDGELYECGVTTRRQKDTETFTFGGDNLSFLGFTIVKANDFIRLIEFEFGKPMNPGQGAKCDPKNLVAVVDEVLTGMSVTESLEKFQGTTKIESRSRADEVSAGASVSAIFGDMDKTGAKVTASYAYTYTKEKTTGTSEEKSKTRGSSVTFDLTDKLMVSYYLSVPCLAPEAAKGTGNKLFLAPFDHRLRRFIAPIDKCLSESGTVQGTQKGGKVDLTIDGDINLNKGSCVLPQKFTWLDEHNMLSDAKHLVDIEGSKVLRKRDKITMKDPKEVPTQLLDR
jgi:hypothetical protein